MQKVVYVLEDRGNDFIFHWFLFMISSLKEFKDCPKPIYFHTFSHVNFQKETFELLKPDFYFLEDLTDCKTINLHGSKLLVESPTDLLEKDCYTFLRNVILKDSLKNNNNPQKYLYISRNYSHNCDCNLNRGGVRMRQLINENSIFPILKEFGFEYIILEEFSLKEKIKLFQDAKYIVTPNGGALTMCLFANEKSKIIEIHDDLSKDENQYYNICKNLDIAIERYTNVSSFNLKNKVSPGCSVEYNLYINDENHFKNYIETVIAIDNF
jgi:capsular polysaccharide biosynthesis protein